MKSAQRTLEVATHGRSLVDVTRQVGRVVHESGVTTGVCHVFCQHTSASLVIQENADPSVLADMLDFFADIAPESRRYRHDDEGPDDMPAHLRAALTKTSETAPVTRGALALGTWQAIYLFEHRRAPHTRRLVVTVLGV